MAEYEHTFGQYYSAIASAMVDGLGGVGDVGDVGRNTPLYVLYYANSERKSWRYVIYVLHPISMCT